MKLKRVIVFIDGSNLYHGFKSSFGKTSINIKAFGEVLVKQISDSELIRIMYYNSPVNRIEKPEDYKNQQKFFQYLEDDPIIGLIRGRLVKRGLKKTNCPICGNEIKLFAKCSECKTEVTETCVEKGVDVHLAVDLLDLAYQNKYDFAILVSNDSDFVGAINKVKKLGKKIIHASFRSPSRHLQQVCNDKISLTYNLIKDCLLK